MINPWQVLRRVLARKPEDNFPTRTESLSTQPGVEEGIGKMGTNPNFHTKEDDKLTPVQTERRINNYLAGQEAPLPQDLNKVIAESRGPVAGRPEGRLNQDDIEKFLGEISPTSGDGENRVA